MKFIGNKASRVHRFNRRLAEITGERPLDALVMGTRVRGTLSDWLPGGWMDLDLKAVHLNSNGTTV